MSDIYNTIASPSIGEFRDRGSKFIAYAYPVYNQEEWQASLEESKRMHPKARHHCYAYRLGLEGNNFRANDDGEPSGTAGRPILGQIDSFELTNIIVIVVRYFGGTKLGTSGLIQAYKISTADALEKATIIKKIVEDVYAFEFDYALMSQVMNTVKKLNLTILKQDFTNQGLLHIPIRKGDIEETLLKIKAGIVNTSLEQAAALKGIPGLKMEFLYTR